MPMKRQKRQSNITREMNKLSISQMQNPRTVGDFIYILYEGTTKAAFNEFDLDFSDVDAAYPNVCVPLAGIVDYYKEIKGTKFNFVNMQDYLSKTFIDSPQSPESCNDNTSLLSKIWIFKKSEDIQWLVDNFIKEVSQATVCRDGVIEGLTWCLNEVMDNVLRHSNIRKGFVMGQIHKSSKHIAFCIFDSGQGIYNSLKETIHNPHYPIDAITLAVKEKVTRDTKDGQGNGMWGLHNIVKDNSGTLTITSSSASYRLDGDQIKTYKKLSYLSKERGATLIDFQIDFDKEIIISKALGGHIPCNFIIENMENAEGNVIEYKLAKKSSGTGTRESGEKIRNDIINIYNQSKKIIEIDFIGVSVISSSFADELIGKLLIHFGFSAFNQIIKLKNTNPIIQAIVDRSVSQRISESFNNL